MNVSELKCCKRCGAFLTCTHKGECCPECEWFDPIDNLCLAAPIKKKEKPVKSFGEEGKADSEIDPDTFLFEDDEEEDDLSDLPPEREVEDDDEEEDDEDFDFEDEDDW